MPYFLSKYDPDPLRYYLTATAPETRDTPAAVLVGHLCRAPRDNNELVATWGNLANRMLSFAYKRFDGKVPEPRPLDDEDRALLTRVEAGFDTVGELYASSAPLPRLPSSSNCRFHPGLRSGIRSRRV